MMVGLKWHRLAVKEDEHIICRFHSGDHGVLFKIPTRTPRLSVIVYLLNYLSEHAAELRCGVVA